MLDYVREIAMPFLERLRSKEEIDNDQAALVIIDNFRGRTTSAVNNLVEKNNT